MQLIGSLEDDFVYLSGDKGGLRLVMQIKQITLTVIIQHVWKERNKRVFQNKERDKDRICRLTESIVKIISQHIKRRIVRKTMQRSDDCWKVGICLSFSRHDLVVKMSLET